MHIQKYFLAATLSSSSVGIYGPVFEYMIHRSIYQVEEEYLR
jgi:starch synthase (maltosyl-transferring)